MGKNAFFYQVRKKHMQGNELSCARGASAALVRQIAEILVDMASGHVVYSSDGHIILREPGDKLLDICVVRLKGQRTFVQSSDKLV